MVMDVAAMLEKWGGAMRLRDYDRVGNDNSQNHLLVGHLYMVCSDVRGGENRRT
jgi:hypothetical protein